VTLPCTLWFFDKAKPKSAHKNTVLFIDARNIFTQIDRAHREFSEEQVQNIAIISQLHKGRREKFVALVDRYFAAGMERLVENKSRVEPVSAQLLEVLDDDDGKQAVRGLVKQWAALAKLQARYESFLKAAAPSAPVAKRNKAQHELRAAFDPFFAALHEGLKQLDKIVRHHEKQQSEQAQAGGKRGATDKKTKALKSALEELHKEVKNAEIFYQHIQWLQERFPKAEYEDVTGLCKLASPAEVQEQEFSLNPGRYVGVVIEEDGKTEEEFVDDVLSIRDELNTLSVDSSQLESVISTNLKQLVGSA